MIEIGHDVIINTITITKGVLVWELCSYVSYVELCETNIYKYLQIFTNIYKYVYIANIAV